MGSPKALVPFLGAPLLCRSLKRLGPIADELIVTTNDQASLDFLCSRVKFDKLKMHSDLIPTRSALNGLQTALFYSTSTYVATVACDMIFPSAPLILAEVEALERTGADLAVPKTSHGFEPFHAVYRREACLPQVQAALAAGERRAQCFYSNVNIIEFSSEDVLKIDPRGGSFVNVNTPEELQAVEQRIIRGEFPERNALPTDVIVSTTLQTAASNNSVTHNCSCLQAANIKQTSRDWHKRPIDVGSCSLCG
jgi:molybdopterin-guanine dinucleotide biosynthesis protein A